MSFGTTLNKCLLILLTTLAPAALGQAGAGYVTEVFGPGATRGADGPAFESESGGVYQDDSIVRPGERIATLPAMIREDGSSIPAGATVFFPQAGVVVSCDSETVVEVLSPEALGVAVAVAVRSGSATVAARSSSDQWILVAADTAGGPAYLVARGATIRVEAAAPGASAFRLIAGDGHTLAGPVPAGRVIDDQGHPLAGEPATEMDATAGDTLRLISQSSYAMGIERGAAWIARAEQGDFTPVRESSRASAEFFGQRVGGPESTFDQPRAAPVTTTPRVAVDVTRSPAVSPAIALLESRVPTSVVAGQRIRRTRIIGTSGLTVDQIRVNPFFDPLLALAGRGGN